MLEHSIFVLLFFDFILFVYAQKLNWKKVSEKKRRKKRGKPALPQ